MDIPSGSIGLFGRLMGSLFGRWLERPKLAIEISFNSSGSIPEPQFGQYKGIMKDGREGWNMQQRIFNRYNVTMTNTSYSPATGMVWLFPVINNDFYLEDRLPLTKVLKTGESLSTEIEYIERKRFVGGDIREYVDQRDEPLVQILIAYRNLHGQMFYTRYSHATKENEYFRKKPK